MGLAKKSTATTEKLPTDTQDFRGEPETKAVESGATAAIARLKTKALPKSESHSGYKPRDFDAEARGKTRCVQFEAAVKSPAIAGMKWSTTEEYLAIVRQVADAGVRYTFGE